MKAVTAMVAVAGLVAGSLTVARPAMGQDPTEKKTFAFPHVLDVVGKAIDQPIPDGMSSEDQEAFAAHTTWLKSVRSRIEAMAAQRDVRAPRDAASGQASGKRQHAPIKITKEWGALLATIEEESRQFNTLSNASKNRHDMAMNAIRNMK